MIDFNAEAQEIYPELKSFYEDMHAHPELGNQEQQTTTKILSFLTQLGLETRRPLPTGAVGILHGSSPGKTVAFRADIDALPVQEKTNLPYASRISNSMHACGHDVHTTCLLGAANILARHKETISGTIVFIFQPDEEGDGGAQRILDTGILDELGVITVYGMHIQPKLPFGTIGVKYGSFYANAVTIDGLVQGKGTHAAEPEKGTDSLAAAARMVTALKQLTNGDVVCTIGSFHAGTIRNIIPDSAEFHGILRCQETAVRDETKKKIEEICQAIARQTGVTVHLTLKNGYDGIVNHDMDSEFVKSTVSCPVVVEEKPTFMTEDFGFYLEKYYGCFYHLGIGTDVPLHSPLLCPDEKILSIGSATAAKILYDWGKR